MIPLFFLLLVNEGRWHLFVEEVAHRVDDIRRGVRHASGWARRSGRRVRLKPCSKGWPATPRKRSAKRQRIRGYQSSIDLHFLRWKHSFLGLALASLHI